jgi:hypothetical protein
VDARHRRALVLGVVGLAPLANPLYRYPDGVSYETTYTYGATQTERIPDHLGSLRADVETCSMYPLQSVDCAVTRDLARGDVVALPLRPDETVGRDLLAADFVRTLDGDHRPTAAVEVTRRPTGWGWREPPRTAADALRLAG